MYWEPDKECMEREELEQYQIERLQAILNRVYAHVPYYRSRFDELGIQPEEVGSLADVRRLPITTREDLRAHYPYGFFAMPLREVIRIHTPTGSPGANTAMGFTRNDIKHWTNLTARILVAGGVTKDDVVQVALDYGLFSGSFGLHSGAERIGAAVIPLPSPHMARQARIMRDFKTTALVATPSFALRLAEELRTSNIPVSSLSLKWALLGEEPWSEETRKTIQDALGVVATDHYGLMEIMDPGIAGECGERNGMHVQEDHFLVEIVNPDTLEPVAPGEVGELVITTLTKEAFPLIRFRTRDLAAFLPGACPCGRTGRRLTRLKGAPTTWSASAASTSTPRRSKPCSRKSKAGRDASSWCSTARPGRTRPQSSSRRRNRSSSATCDARGKSSNACVRACIRSWGWRWA